MPFQESGLAQETYDWRRRVLQVGGVSVPTLRRVDRAISRLKSAGLWSGVNCINIAVGDTLVSSLVPQKVGTGAEIVTAVNLTSDDYSETTGWMTDGSTKYLNTGLLCTGSTGGLFIYLRTDIPSEATARVLFGGRSTAHVHRLHANSNTSGTTTAGAVNGRWGGATNSTANPSTTGGMVKGAWHNERRASNNSELLFNGVSVSLNTGAQTNGDGENAYVLCNNNLGSANGFSPAGTIISTYAITTGVFDVAGCTLFADIIRDFEVSMGRGV